MSEHDMTRDELRRVLFEILNTTGTRPAADEVLAVTPAGDDIRWSATAGGGPCCHVYRDVDQAINNATLTAIIWNQELFDTDSMWEGVTNPTRITFNTAGTYLVGGNVSWEVDPNDARLHVIRPNGGALATCISATWVEAVGAAASRTEAPFATVLRYFGIGDFIEFLVFQGSGGALNVDSGYSRLPCAWAVRVA